MIGRTFTEDEILRHGLLYLTAFNNGIVRWRIISAGGNPDTENDNKKAPDYSHESDMSSADFFGEINDLF